MTVARWGLVDARDASLYDWSRAVDIQGANRAVE
jgi:hypothetical protein